MQPNKKNTRDFRKYLERDLDLTHKNFNCNSFFIRKNFSTILKSCMRNIITKSLRWNVTLSTKEMPVRKEGFMSQNENKMNQQLNCALKK